MKSRLKFTATLLTIITVSFLFNSKLSFANGSQPYNRKEIKGKTVLKVLKSSNKTAMFARLLKESGYSKILTKKGPFTVLAPNNNAVKSDVNVSQLKKNPTKLKSLIRHHLYQGNLSKKKVESALGVKIVSSHQASNGVVYVISSVVQQAPSNG